MLKRVEQLSAVTFRTSLEGRSTRSVGRESLGVKRSIRVQAIRAPREVAVEAYFAKHSVARARALTAEILKRACGTLSSGEVEQ